MNGESCQDIEFCFLEEFKGLRNVVVLKHTDIIVADREGMSWILQIHIVKSRMLEVVHYGGEQEGSDIQSFKLSNLLQLTLLQVNITTMSHIGCMQICVIRDVSFVTFVDLLDKGFKFSVIE